MDKVGIRTIVVNFDDEQLPYMSLVQGDAKTRGFDIVICDSDGKEIPPNDDYIVELVATGSNAPDTPYANRHTIKDGKYRVMIPTEALSKSGFVFLQLVFYQKSTGAVIHTIEQKCPVYRSRGQEVVESNNLYVDITALRLGIEKIAVMETAYLQVLEDETTRKSQETARQSAEDKRVSAETIRDNNEEKRKSNEIKREDNEGTRIAQEEERVTAEDSRTEIFGKMTESLEDYKTPLATDTVAGKVKIDKTEGEEAPHTVPTIGRFDTEIAVLKSDVAKKQDTLKSESLKSSQIQAQTRNVSDLKTMVTFIDDDGYNGVLDILKPMFTTRGVPYVIALRGDAVILQTEEKREQLRDLQNNYGWEMASHTMNHIHLNSSTDKEIEEDSINFLNLMYDYGLDVESIVYPWGETGNTSVISKYYRAGFGTANGVNDITLDDYNIGREILGNSSSRDTAFFKDMVDSIDGKPKWLVFMTHASDPATNVQQIEDVVDYVISKNIPIVTAREGLKHYGSVINSRDNDSTALGKYTRIKPSGLIDSNRYLLNYHGVGNNGNVITGDSLPSDFDIGVTTKSFTNQTAPPLPFGGVLVTTKPVATRGYTSQLLYGNVSSAQSEPRILYRTSLVGSDGWSGWVSLNGINHQGVTEDSPITDFQYGESVRLAAGWSLGNGTVKTIRSSANESFGRQLYFPASNVKIYTRRVSGGGWSDWVEITPSTQSHTRLSINSMTGDDLIGAYPNNVSVMPVNFNGATGFPGAGVVTTYRIHGNGWDYQNFSKYDSFEMYKRYVKTDGSWSDWKQIQMVI